MSERKVAWFILLTAGILLIISVVIPALKFLYEWHQATNSNRIFGLLYRWQTIYQSWIEVLLGFIAGSGVLWQVHKEKEQIESDAQKKLNAMRSVLVIDLAEIYEYLVNDAKEYDDLFRMEDLQDEESKSDVFHISSKQIKNKDKINRDTICSLRDFVELSTGDVLNSVELLLREIQLYEARTSDIRVGRIIPFSRLEVISNITWNILLQERVNSLFPYARKQIDTPKNIYTYKDLENIVL
ncbi:MAG: hypothetical protein ABF876_16295, partial [Acetobacter aceti]